MKKYLHLALLIPVFGFSQTKRTTLNEEKIGTLNCKYIMSVDMEKADTLKFVYIGFQNMKYTAITDISSIVFTTNKDSSDLVSFRDDLKKALPDVGTKTDITWSRKQYSLALYDFAKDLFLSEPKSDGEGYTKLSKKDVDKLLIWIEKIGS